MDSFVTEYFQVGELDREAGDSVYGRNMPTYANLANNFQDFMVTLDRKDW